MNIRDKLDRLYPKLSIGRKCVVCGKNAQNQHHIIPRNNELLRYNPRNLLSLCYDCHSKLHDKGLWSHGLDLVDEDTQKYLLEMRSITFKDYLLQHNLTKEEFFEQQERELKNLIGKTEYQQNTEEWLEQKNYGIGASEIAAVVKSFVPVEDLEKIMGEKVAHSFIDEPLYSTGYQVYHKIARGYRIPPLEDELSVYGHTMEKYLDWKMQDDEMFDYQGTTDFIKRPDISKYAVCSPDGYATLKLDSCVDVNNRLITTKDFVWEKKTVSPFKAAKENVFYNGLPFQYIFQNQYQMMLCNREAGIISSVILEKDTPFNRGIICGLIESGEFEAIDYEYNPRVDNFIYGKISEIWIAIEEGLHNFEIAVEKGNPPEINKSEPRLALSDFKIYQTIYKGNPEGRKLASSVEEYDGVNLHDWVSDYIFLNQIIKDNKKQDDLNKVKLKKYLYDNNLCSIYTMDAGEVYLSKSGSILVKNKL